MKYILWCLAISSSFLAGTQLKNSGRLAEKATQLFDSNQKEKLFAVQEHKPFVIIIPSYNNSLWAEKNLRSVFEQKYDNFRVIYINDASTDGTSSQVDQLIHSWGKNHQIEVIDNLANQGAMENIYRSTSLCDPNEIVLVLDGDDWLAHDRVIEKLNEVYANPDVWATWGSYVEYPNYSIKHVANFSQPIPLSVIQKQNLRKYSKNHWCFSQLRTFYAGLFQQLKLQDLIYEGKFVDAANDVAFFIPVLEMAGTHIQYVPEVLYIWNRATPLNDDKIRGKRQLEIAQATFKKTPYFPLKCLPNENKNLEQTADLIIFSYNRPLQLYALLESTKKHCVGINEVQVIYRFSDEDYAAGYQQVKADFPHIKMVAEQDFKANVTDALMSGKSEYFLFAVDDIIITDRIDIHQGVLALQQTDAYGFFYRLGKEIVYDYMLDIPLDKPNLIQVNEDMYAWLFKQHQGYWGYPTSTDLVLYRKERILDQLEKIAFTNPNELETEWLKITSSNRLGLCHQTSRMVNIPLNLVTPSTNRNMNSLNPKKLLDIFNQNLKIDVEALNLYPHQSAHIHYHPSFIPREPKVKIDEQSS